MIFVDLPVLTFSGVSKIYYYGEIFAQCSRNLKILYIRAHIVYIAIYYFQRFQTIIIFTIKRSLLSKNITQSFCSNNVFIVLSLINIPLRSDHHTQHSLSLYLLDILCKYCTAISVCSVVKHHIISLQFEVFHNSFGNYYVYVCMAPLLFIPATFLFI